MSQEHCVVVVRAVGELDMASAEHMRDALSIACGSGASVTVDVSQLTFIDASGLRVLVAAHSHLLRSGCSGLVVQGASGFVRRVFEITDLTFLLVDLHGHELDVARRAAGMSVTELFIGYFALGGTSDMAHVLSYLAGRVELFDPKERDVLVHVVNERFIDLARTDYLLSYASG